MSRSEILYNTFLGEILIVGTIESKRSEKENIVLKLYNFEKSSALTERNYRNIAIS